MIIIVENCKNIIISQLSLLLLLLL